DVVSKSVHWEHHEIYQTGKYYVGHNVFTGTGTINVKEYDADILLYENVYNRN
ncbi:unnamed protein product, partial [marine sediment metagenome]